MHLFFVAPLTSSLSGELAVLPPLHVLPPYPAESSPTFESLAMSRGLLPYEVEPSEPHKDPVSLFETEFFPI